MDNVCFIFSKTIVMSWGRGGGGASSLYLSEMLKMGMFQVAAGSSPFSVYGQPPFEVACSLKLEFNVHLF